MDIFFLQLAIIFLPGLVWERIDAQFAQKRVPTQFDVLRRTFVFGVVAYIVTYGICRLLGFPFELFEPKKDSTFLGETAVREIFIATFVAFSCSIVWLYFVNFKILMRFMKRIRATKRYGDEDVWDFTFNAHDRNVEYVHLRDFDKEIVYAGWVERFSDTEKVRELVLHDVKVYDFEGNELFATPRARWTILTSNFRLNPREAKSIPMNNSSKGQDRPRVPPLAQRGYENKGGHNAPTSQVTTRPPPPAPISSKPASQPARPTGKTK